MGLLGLKPPQIISKTKKIQIIIYKSVSPEHPHKFEGIIPHKKIVLENYPLIFTLKNKRVFLEDIFLNKKLEGIFRERFEHRIIRGYF